jgi:hypothetical protein
MVAAAVVLLAGIGVTLFFVLQPKPAPTTVKGDIGEVKQREAVAMPKVRFTDITDKAGIHFRHTNGMGKKLLPETMGAGVAFLDYDNDGKQDILFVNSCYWPGQEQGRSPTLALYRNKGDETFEDVTVAAGLDVCMFGMGVTAGDFDNDGWIDLFITGVGGNRLFHNESDGKGGRRFVDVTESAGVGGPGGWPRSKGQDFFATKAPLNFSSSAAFLDYDGDGLLDLFVCNYVQWSPEFDLSQPFTLAGVGRAFGPPRVFGGTHCFLYRNQGNGKFEEVSAQAGIQKVLDLQNRPAGKSLAVSVVDVDRDGWPDIIVANDTVRNFLFHNESDGKGGRRFTEIGKEAGIAFGSSGQEQGAMGSDYAEYRPDRTALLIGNFTAEPNTFMMLENPKSLAFRDMAQAEGIAGPSRPWLKFGVFFFDFDLDGRLDLLTCNGHLEPEIATTGQSSYEQPVQMFWNTGGKPCFAEVLPEHAGADLFKPQVGRGCAFADINGDGTLDIVLTANGGRARLLKNEGGTGNHWIRLTLEGDGVRSNRSAIGARVTLEAGGQKYEREVISARGYLSQSELTLTFGLGKTAKVDRVTIYWPGAKAGPAQVISEGLEIDRTHVIKQK